MPPGGQDRRAAQTGAKDILTDEIEDVTALVCAFPQTEGDRRAHTLDFAFFARNRHRESYIREYLEGELPTPMVEAQPEGTPSHVAVGYVCPGERVRVFIWPGHSRSEARRNAEKAAELHRIKLGMKGRA